MKEIVGKGIGCNNIKQYDDSATCQDIISWGKYEKKKKNFYNLHLESPHGCNYSKWKHKNDR